MATDPLFKSATKRFYFLDNESCLNWEGRNRRDRIRKENKRTTPDPSDLKKIIKNQI